MKRLHVHVAVDNLERSIGFYSALFAAKPSVTKSDYAKWMLDDPKVNFAISARGGRGFGFAFLAPNSDHSQLIARLAHCHWSSSIVRGRKR